MKNQLFVNLPISDLKKTMDFFAALGFTFNKQFTDDKAACMPLNDGAYVMLLRKEFFTDFIRTKSISDATQQTEVINSISCDSKEEVDAMVNKAFAAGAKPSSEKKDMGFMYQWGFEDLDGHLWEVFWMDLKAFAEQQQPQK